MANPKWRRQAKNATSAKILEEMKKNVGNYYFRAEYIDTQIKGFPLFFSVFFFYLEPLSQQSSSSES